MAIEFWEKTASRRRNLGDNPSIELIFGVQTTNNETDVEVVTKILEEVDDAYNVLAELPAVFLTLPLRNVSIEPDQGDSLYEVTVRYAASSTGSPPAVSDVANTDPLLSFDTSGGTVNLKQSIATIASYPAGAADFDGAINVGEDEVVEGVDIIVPQLVIPVDMTHPAADIDTAYILTITDLTGRVNDATFLGFAAGEVLFLGCQGRQRYDKDALVWDITYRFRVARNATGLAVGSITGIAKKGHEFLWVRYETVEDTTAKKIVKRPVAAYVEQVYKTGNFAGLLI